jgi:3-hydroxybutyryl-CoA dehydrogenase
MSLSESGLAVVVGAGIMGRGIALSFAQGGLQVRMVDREQGLLDRAAAQIDSDLKLLSSLGLIASDGSEIKQRITPCMSLKDASGGSHMVIEAVPELLPLKKQIFSDLESLCPGDAILCTNTSSLGLASIVEGLRSPHRVVGTHWFNPAHIMPLVEIVPGPETSPQVINKTKELMLKIGKKPIVIKRDIPGFLVNRIQVAMKREIDYLLEQGIADVKDIDFAVKMSFGLRLSCFGPFEVSDMVGLDTSFRVAQRLYKELDNRTEPSSILEEKVSRGHLGIKTGQGWYDYSGRSVSQILEERDRRLLSRLYSLGTAPSRDDLG